VYGERDSNGLYKKLRLAHATNENPNGENCVPGTDGHWVKYIYAQSLTPLGHWQSANCPYPVNSIVNLGGSIYSSKIETSRPPMGLLLNGAGTDYILNGENNYIIVDETTNDDWELLLNVGDITNGTAGQDAITINLTNDTDSVFTDEHGNIPTGTVYPTTTAQLYEGMELIDTGVTWAIDWSKTTGAGTQASPLASINTTTGIVTTWGMSADKTIICIKATYRQREYRKEFTFHKTFGKDKLWIECDHNVIKYNPNTQVYSPMSLQVRAYIKRGSTGSVQEVTQASGFGYIRYSTNGQASNTVYHGGTITINDNSFIGDHLILTLYSADGQVEDVEDIPRVVDGLNAKTLLAEYSADCVNWHGTFTDGDLWMRTKQEGDDQWGDPIKIVGEDGEEMRYDFAISKSKVSASSTTPPTNISPAGWTDGPQEVTSEFPYLWMKMTPVDKEGNATGASKYVRLTGEKGQSSFKSTVFIRTNDQPSVPEGGSYENPVPTTAGWSDGIPAGDAILWASTRIFTSDGLSPQQAVWSTPRQQTDTATYDVEFSMSETQPAAPNNDNRADGSGNAATWYDPDKDKNNSHADWTLMNWRAERDCKNGVWGDWVITRVRGEKGDNGQSCFKSIVFMRSNETPARPTGGSYASPIPSTAGWTDGIPATPAGQIIWASSRIFTSDGLAPQQSQWSEPRQQSDTATYDVEFSMSETEPVAPNDENRADGNGLAATWYDTIKDKNNIHADWTKMKWRAERDCVNGVWGDWVISRIWGEKGDKGDKGDPGADGNGFASRGHWVTGTEAAEGDVFIFGDALYLTTQANTDVPPVMSLLQDGAGNRVLNGEGGYVIINKAINSSYYSFFLEGYEQPVIPETVSVVDIEEYYARSKTNDPNTPPSVPVRQDNGKVYYDATVWNPGRPLLATDAEYPFLWNFELTTFSDGTQTFSYPHCIGNFADGVTDIENYYQISAKSQPETGREYPSDIVSWSQQNIVPTDLKPFQWNKEVIRMKGGSEVVSYHVSSVKGDTDTLDIEFSPSTTQPNAPTGNTPFANHESEGWYDPKSANFNNVGTMIWRAERKVRNGQYEADSSWVITRIYGQSSFKSTVFCRSNSKPNTPSGGSYANPIPDGWYDGIPDGTAIVWASSRIFTNDGQSPQQSQWSEPRQQTDTVDYDVEFSPNTNQPANPSDTVANRNSQGWYDPDRNPSFDFTTSIWRAERHCKNGVWGNWAIEKIKGEKGNTGQSSFKSTVFCRSNSASGPGTPTGGSYNSPVPTTSGWSDGIPEGTAILWASTRIFTSDGLSPQQSVWTTPRQQTDTADYDVEFSPNTTKPANPSDTVSQRNAQGWYDPDRNPSFDFTTSIWRAERHCKNGVWGNWAVEKIKGEKGDDGVHYYMDVSPKSAVKNVDGQFVSGSSISIRMYKQVGRNSPVLLTDFTECALQFTNNGTRTDIGWVASGVYAITIGTNVSSLTIKMVLQSDTSIILDTLNYNFITNGAQGLQGCVTRVTEWKASTEYRNDDGVDFSGSSTAIGYIDVVARPDDVNATGWKFYRCLRTHTSGSSFALTQSGNTVWQELSDVGPLYTSLLVAKNAYIKFGTGNQFVITTAGADKSPANVSVPSGYTLQYSTNGSSWNTYTQGIGITKPSSGSVWFRLLDSNSAVVSRVEVPVLPDSGYSLVVDRSYDTVLKTDDGVIRDTLTQIKAYIYNGQTSIASTAGTWNITGSGCTVDYSGTNGNAKLIKVTNVTSDTASVTIKCTWNGTQKTYTVSLVRRKENVKYYIEQTQKVLLSSNTSVNAWVVSWTKTDKVVAGMRGTGIWDDSIRFWAGSTSNSDITTAPFRVTHAGKLYATNAEITGVINATSGSFTGTIYASGGSITGDMNVTGILTIGQGSTVIKLHPAYNTAGAGIRALCGSEEAFSLTFSQFYVNGYHSRALLKMASVVPYNYKQGSVEISDLQTKRSLTYNTSTDAMQGTTYTVEESYDNGMFIKITKDNTNQCTLKIGITSSGVITVQAQNVNGATGWPNDASQVNKGGLYRDNDGYLRVRLT
jgi:hypothetical protein